MAEIKRSPKACGFTLLELLVVLVLIGVILSFAGLSVGDGGQQQHLEREGRRLRSLVQLATQEAVMRQVQIGVVFSRHRYRFVQWQSLDQTWAPFAADEVFRGRRLTEGMALQLRVEGMPVAITEDLAEIPQLVLYSSGEITPFECRLFFPPDDERGGYQLQGALTGQLQLSRQPPDT